jgi:DNA polymerase-3 subunit gamma/tau
MAYQVLARKYRPQRFSDVVGQDHVTRTLLNALAQDRIAHGYIFSGHRGIGKTTIARILAMALNCRTAIGTEKRPSPEPCEVCESCTEIKAGNAVDVIEIDAATNRGIDEIRELRDAARYAPSRDRYKIYILDEAHQITDAAFNALLKTLEEPPPHIIFMMATTQPEDIPQTIRSRCQHFSFHAVKLDDIVGQLRRIATAEHILADDATLSLLAEAGDGSMRDALSIMDQAIASAPMVPDAPSTNPGAPSSPTVPSSAKVGAGASPSESLHPHLELTQIRELMGSVSNVVYEQILEAVHANNSADVLAITGRLLDAGNGAPQLARQFVRYLRNTIVAKITGLSAADEATGIAADLLQISPEERRRAARSAALFTEEELARFLSIILRTFDDLGYRQEQRFHLELGLLKLVHMQRLVPIEELLSQLGAKPTSTPTTSATTPGTPNPATPPGTPKPTTPPGAPSSATVPSSPKVGIATANLDSSSHLSRPAAPPPPYPFESDRTRKVPSASTVNTTTASTATEGALALADHPAEASAPYTGPKLVVAPQPPIPSSPPAPTPPAIQAPLATQDLSSRREPAHTPTQDLSSRPESSQPYREDAAERPAVPTGDELATRQSAIIYTPSLQAAELIAPVITSPAAPPTLAALQSTLAAALAAVKGQQSASEQIEDATLTLAADTLTIQTTLSKTMLPVVFNSDAERILKSTLREHSPTLKLTLLSGVPMPASSPKKPRPAATGSAAELAEKHPMIQQAKRLFSADISNVIDLRDKN